MYWVKYRYIDCKIGNVRVKCRLFYDYNNAIDFANTISSVRMINYSIPGY
jgi:hypothetical protein